MVSIGDLDRRIVVERASVSQNGFGEDVPEWHAVLSLWAKRADVSDGEKAAMGEVGSQLRSRFTVRAFTETRAITPQDRIRHDGAVWQIVGVKEAMDRPREFIEITAVRDSDRTA